MPPPVEPSTTYDLKNPPFPNAMAHTGVLMQAVLDDPLIITVLNGVSIDESGSPKTVDFDFADTLTAAEGDALDEIVDTHLGVQTTIVVLTSSAVVGLDIAVTTGATWQIIGGVAARVSLFLRDMSAARFRQTIDVKTSGLGAQLQLIEDDRDADSESPMLGDGLFANVPDTSGSWASFEFQTIETPVDADCVYRLEGRLNGADSLVVRFGDLTLLEVTVENGVT